MAHVYVLHSLKNGKRYIGSTTKDPEHRLKEHNQGNTTWTGKNKPFKLVYSEAFDSLAEAHKRERYFKSGSGREWLQRRSL